MKYRRLGLDELRELEQEFVKFLASNSITADDWVNIKKNDPEKADGLLDIFSDVVFEKVLMNVSYLEHRRRSDYRVYKFHDDHIEMIGIMTEGESALDFTRQDSPGEMMAKLQLSGAKVQLFAGTKAFKFTKEMEIFKIMEEGALITKDATLFQTLKGMAKK